MNTIATLERPTGSLHALDGDEPLFEIIDGQRVEIPHMSTAASLIASRLMGHLFLQARDQGHLAIETLFHLALPIDRNRRPDLAFVPFGRWSKDRPYGSESAWDVLPDLAVEVVSPHDYAEEIMEKLDEYFRAGIRLVWVIYPTQALVYVYESLTNVRGLGRADVLDGGSVLPAFRLPLNELFPPT